MKQDFVEGNRRGFEDNVQETSTRSPPISNEDIPARRAVLRGALAVGISLLIPGVLLGCDARKSASPTDAAPVSPPAAGTDATAPTTAAKATQASVQYQAQPKDDRKCDQCQHFIAGSNTCELVDGQISPSGWCSLWTKKT